MRFSAGVKRSLLKKGLYWCSERLCVFFDIIAEAFRSVLYQNETMAFGMIPITENAFCT
jgi:hypothetical protein